MSGPLPVAPGTRLGPYEVVAPLGAGGMGEVYRARDPRLGRDVAVKVVAGHLGRDEEARKRFEREARAVAALSHPNILAIHDVGNEDGRVFAVTELLEGETLRTRLERGALPWRKAVEIAAAIAEGVAAAHSKGVVHRDLKPANVFLSADGRVKVLDFGLAKLRPPADPEDSASPTVSQTSPNRVLGTVGYMSPEQVTGRPIDGRSDIFSLGCTLYEMVAGTRPFARKTIPETMAAILSEDPPDLGAATKTAPPDLGRLIAHCLEKAPEARFQSALDLAFALRSLPGASSLGGDAALDPSGPRPHRGRVGWAGLSIAGLALLGAGGALWASRGRSPIPMPAGLTRLTYDAAYTAEPALSPDGALVAYASDRAGDGNLDLWVHHVAGGDPIRLTRDPVDERQPSFSPDGARLVFRSERDGGGLYTMPALGGEPRFLVEGGYDPRYSPDGRSIAYWTGSFVGFSPAAGSYRTFVVAAAGGPPREIGGFTGARFPVWSPDGKRLLVVASRAELPAGETYDWWIASLEGGEPVQTHAFARLQSAGARLEEGGTTSAAGWLGDQVLVGTGGDLWAVELQAGSGREAGGVYRLTFGPGVEHHPAVTGAGLVAFEDVSSSQNIWSLPLEAESGKVLGPPRRVTEGSGPHGRASLSADGRTLVFLETRARPMVVVKDLDSGRVSDLGLEGRFGPVVSPDGTRVAYPGADSAGYVVPTRGGEPRKICDQCLVGDWTRDSRRVTTVQGPGSGAVLRLVDTGSGDGHDLILAAGGVVNRPHLSPDDRWLAFRLTDPSQKSRVLVAPFRPGSPPAKAEWVPVTPLESDVRPCGWAPSGRVLYLLSSRDGFRCLYAQRIDAATGRPEGPAILVRHLHNIRGPEGGGASIVSTGAGNAVAKNQLLLDYPVNTVNIWTMQLGRNR